MVGLATHDILCSMLISFLVSLGEKQAYTVGGRVAPNNPTYPSSHKPGQSIVALNDRQNQPIRDLETNLSV